MPYGYRKSGDKITVFKTDTGKVVGHTTSAKLKGYLAALHMHSKDMNEISKEAKAAKVKAAQEKLKSIKLQVVDAQKELEDATREPVTMGESFSLSSYIKSILEAEGDTQDADTAAAAEEPSADAEGGSKENKPGPKQDSLQIQFNMANVKKYNNYPVVDNTGTVTGVSKEGVTVLVGDSTIFVNFEDIL